MRGYGLGLGLGLGSGLGLVSASSKKKLAVTGETPACRHFLLHRYVDSIILITCRLTSVHPHHLPLDISSSSSPAA